MQRIYQNWIRFKYDSCEMVYTLTSRCSQCSWKHPPKLGGFGKVVEMDKSHFAGAPKYGKGVRNGEKRGKIILNGRLVLLKEEV